MTGTLRVGVAGWSYVDWRGIVYSHPAQGLETIASLFDVVEINTTFYHTPERRVVSGWAERAPEGFRFTAKLGRAFTHERDWTGAAAARFREALAPLVERELLAALLLQFPFSFRHDERNLTLLGTLARAFEGYRRVLEVRHRSWGEPEATRQVAELGYHLATIDQPVRRDELGPEPFAYGELAYVRLHGRNARAWFARDSGRDQRYDYLYDAGEVEEWAQRIEELLSRAGEVIVIANNHYRGKAPANALELAARLRGQPVRIPETLIAEYPRLARIARREEANGDGQGLLF